jgi:hypothetical protein
MSDLTLFNKYEPDLFTITLPTGTVLRTTSHQQDIVTGGNTYYATKYGKWERDSIKSEPNTVTEVDITLTADTSVLFPGTSKPMLWVSKLFTRSTVKIVTASLALPTTQGPLDKEMTIAASKTVFIGQVTVPSLVSTHTTLKCADMGYLGLKPWPIRVICAGCPFTLFDRGCKLNSADFVVHCTVKTGSTPTNIIVTSALGSVGNDSLPYSRGFIVPTSGEATGWRITVNKQTDSTHLELAPFVLELAVGDTFDLFPGCDGQKATCEFKFSNLDNYGGMPDIPGPPAALSGTGS